MTPHDIAEEAYVDRLKCELRKPFFDFMDRNDLGLNVVCSSQRDDWIQELVVRGYGVSVMPRFSITTRRIGWQKLSGPVCNRRQIVIARAKGLSSQPLADAFFSDATTFEWQSALEALGENARPQ